MKSDGIYLWSDALESFMITVVKSHMDNKLLKLQPHLLGGNDLMYTALVS